MPAEEVTRAIVLRARDYAESDRVVTALTERFGKLAGLAKGAKASRRRFERKLEPFAHVMFYFRRRPHGELVFITRAEAADLEPFNLTDELGRFALGSYMLELCEALTSEGADAAEAYALLAEALSVLSVGASARALRQSFELKMLAWAGFALDFSRCRICGLGAASAGGAFFFVPARGGVVCARCHQRAPEATLKVGAETVDTLARLSDTPRLAVAANLAPAGYEGALALSRFIASVVDRRLRSLDFLDSIGGGDRAR